MNNRLFVGNLSWGTTEDSLRQAFAEFGVVEDVKIVLDRETGRSRGFGFVSMDTEEAAQKAIEGLNGVSIDGRPLRVNLAEERKPRGGGGGPRGGGGGFRGGGGGPGGPGRGAGGRDERWDDSNRGGDDRRGGDRRDRGGRGGRRRPSRGRDGGGGHDDW